MTEQQRYDELKNTNIKVVSYNPENMARSEAELEELENTYKSNAEKILKVLG